MNTVARSFMRAATVYGLVALTLGVYMGASHDHQLLTTHSHLSLIGWVSFAIFAFFYQLLPAAAGRNLAKIHFWIANFGLIVLVTSLVLLAKGITGAEPAAAAGSVLSLAGLAMFLYLVFSETKGTA